MKKFVFIIIALVVLGLGYGLISLLGDTDGSNSQEALDGFGFTRAF
ncbi:MAG: hypothetical protein AAF413_01440 [Patescibacteria group bacterium]